MKREPGSPISQERLIAAAEAGLIAAWNAPRPLGGPRPYPADLMNCPHPPACLEAFTRREIELASAFLVRLGLIEKPGEGRGPPRRFSDRASRDQLWPEEW